MAARLRKSRPDRLSRLASAIEAIGDRDQKLIAEASRVEQLRIEAAVALHAICRGFVDGINAKLSNPAVVLSPGAYTGSGFDDPGPNLFQINLRGRLLQLEFHSTEELYARDDFRRPYILRGAVRSFNQEFLNRNSMDEQQIFYCPQGEAGSWHYFDCRTYRTGLVGEDYLASEMERLL